MGGDHAAAAQDGHAVGQLEDLVETVRDVEHARARAPHLADHREQPLDLVVRAGPPSARRARARRCRPASPAAPRRSRPRSARPASRRPAGGGCRDRRRSARARGGSPASCSRQRTRPIAPRAKPPCSARLSIALSSSTRPRSWWTKRSPSGTACPRSNGAPSSSATAAGIGGVVAGERLDQRRLAGAVLAHERVDLAGLDVERRVDQRARGPEGLRQPGDVQHGRRRRGSVAAGRVLHGSLCHVTHGRRSGLVPLLIELN